MKAERDSTSVQQKLPSSWVCYHKYHNLLCCGALSFYLVSLILTGIMLLSPQAVLAQSSQPSSEGYKTLGSF